MTGECSRCGVCCRVLPLSIAGMTSAHIKYLRIRGLKEDQGFFLIPHTCQHLVDLSVKETSEPHMACRIHDSPDRPFVCQKYHGQERIGRARIYIPPECTMREK